VMQDYFTKWPKAIPLKDATAKSVAGALLLVILTWEPPAELLSNQGLEFVVELNGQFLRQRGIKRQNATAYHPQTNREVEWFSRGGQEAHFGNIESEQQDQVESMPHWSRTWEAGNQLSNHGQSAEH